MARRPAPLDMLFFALEGPTRPMHMAMFATFQIPEGRESSFVPELFEAFRGSKVQPPFDQRLRWETGALPRWEGVEPDLSYHVRRVAAPAPGGPSELFPLLETLVQPHLDRNLPLWECTLVEGLAGNRFALVFKVHHAYMDGQGGVRIFEDALSDAPEDTAIRPFWGLAPRRPRPAGGRRRQRGEARRAAGPGKAASDLASQLGLLPRLAGDLLAAGGEQLGLLPRSRALPFAAPRTRLNEPVASSARRFGCCDLPVDVVRAVGAAHDATLNDVVMCVIDAGLERTLAELGARPDAALVALMAVSLRAADHDAASNQVAALPVPLGAPDADVIERLRQIAASTRAVKARARRTPGGLLQGYTAFVVSSAALLDALPGLAGRLPSFNLIVSNVRGPEQRLYLNGAPLLGAYALPIVPPGAAMNITVFSYDDTICLGVGTTPTSFPDTARLLRHVEAALAELAEGLPEAGA